MSNPGKVFALPSIKPHTPPRVWGPRQFTLSFSTCDRTPRDGMPLSRWLRHRGLLPNIQHPSFTCTTRVSNRCLLPSFAPQRQYRVQVAAFATDVPPRYLRISLYTWNSPPSPDQSRAVSRAVPLVEPWISPNLQQPTRALRSNSINCSRPPYYRGCWHGVSLALSIWRYRHTAWLIGTMLSSLLDRGTNPTNLHPHAARCVRLSSIAAIFPTARSRTWSLDRVSVPVVAGHLFRPGYPRCPLVGLLPVTN